MAQWRERHHTITVLSLFFVLTCFRGFALSNGNPFGIWVGEPSNNMIESVKGLNSSMIHGHLHWVEFEPSDDDFHFDKFEDDLNMWNSEGIHMTYVIKIGRNWATGDSPSQQRPSHVPLDLNEVWDPDYGYSETYYDFIYNFITYCNVPVKRVKCIIIENEPDSPYWFDGTCAEFVGIIKTAYKAAKDADPDILVTCGGSASMSFGLFLPRQMIELHNSEGLFTEDQILDFANDYWRRYRYNPCFDSYEEIEAWAMDPERRNWTFFTNFIDNLVIDELPGDPLTIDAFNFHYTEDYRHIQHIVKFLEYRLYSLNDYPTIPLCSDHMGFRIPKGSDGKIDFGYLRSFDHVNDVFKYLVICLYNNFPMIQHYQMLAPQSPWVGDKASLGVVDGGGNEIWHPSAGAFKTVAGLISDKYLPLRDEPKVVADVSFYPFYYVENEEYEPVTAVWTESASPVTLKVPIPGAYSTIRRIDYMGETRDRVVPHDRIVEHTFTGTPYFYQLLD